MKLYHTSTIIVDKPDVYHSREHLDFGKGFYLTTLYEQACKYAQRFLLRNRPAYVNHYLLDEDLKDFNIKKFETIDLYFAGIMSKDNALGRLAFEHPNHQICILNQEVINRHLHFVTSEEIIIE